jgi:hypothetical protein
MGRVSDEGGVNQSLVSEKRIRTGELQSTVRAGVWKRKDQSLGVVVDGLDAFDAQGNEAETSKDHLGLLLMVLGGVVGIGVGVCQRQ